MRQKTKIEEISLEDDYDEIRKNACLKDLKRFVKTFWDVVVPNQLVWNWHMGVLCDEIQEVYERVFLRLPKKNDLIINVPPGTSKTKILSVMATCWAIARMPEIKIFVGSYSDSAVLGISDEIKIILRSELYASYFPNVQIRRGMDSKHEFRTTKNGQFFAFTIGGTITSKHADILVVDDPLNPKQAASESSLEVAKSFMSKTLPSRKVDKAVTPTLLIMQRLHENDPSGILLKKKGEKIHHICLPAELSIHVKPEKYKDFYKDGLLDKLRLNREVLDEAKIDLGSIAYSGQYGQTPTAEGGNIVKSDWFQYVSMEHFLRIWDRRQSPMVFFGDTAYTDNSDENDPSGFIATCKIQNDLYIYSAKKVYLKFPDLIKFLPEWVKTNWYSGGSSLRIEPKANGLSVIQQLQSNSGLSVIKTPSPKDDKKTRLTAASPRVEAGRVFLVHGPWNEEFVDEICGFPNKAHDEYVDVLCYAVDYHLKPQTKNTSEKASYF